MRVSLTILLMLLCSALLGYQVGIFPVASNAIDHVFHLQAMSLAMVSASLPLAAAVFAVVTGVMSDRVGRRLMLMMAAAFFAMGAMQCASSESLLEFVFGRLMLGAAVGMSAVVAPLYLVEIAPVAQRGQWVAFCFLSVNVGIFCACLIGGMFAQYDAWRMVIALSAIPAVLLGGLSFFIPESPRWLILHGLQGQASQGLIKLFGAKRAMEIISGMEAVDHRTIYQPVKLLSHQGTRILLLGMLINIFSQAIGIHAIVTYATMTLERAGWTGYFVDLLSNLFIAIIFMVAAMSSAHLIDQLSRRKMLLFGLAGIVVSLIVVSWGFHNMHQSAFSSVFVLLGCVLFIGCQGFSLGPMASLLPAEIFPQSLRGVGMGLSIAAGWVTKTIIVYAFPKMLGDYGANISFVTFLFFALLAWVWCYFSVPETSRVPLEKLERNLLSGHDNRDLGFNADELELDAS